MSFYRQKRLAGSVSTSGFRHYRPLQTFESTNASASSSSLYCGSGLHAGIWPSICSRAWNGSMLGRMWDFCFANAHIAGSARNYGNARSPQRRAGLEVLRGGREACNGPSVDPWCAYVICWLLCVCSWHSSIVGVRDQTFAPIAMRSTRKGKIWFCFRICWVLMMLDLECLQFVPVTDSYGSFTNIRVEAADVSLRSLETQSPAQGGAWSGWEPRGSRLLR